MSPLHQQLAAAVGEVVARFEGSTQPLVRSRLMALAELEVDEARGIDVTLGRQAVLASMASIAAEEQQFLVTTALKVAVKAAVMALA